MVADSEGKALLTGSRPAYSQAPSTITNVIAPSVSWNSKLARGNHAIDGIVWRPVMSDPVAVRRILLPPTTNPTAVPMTNAARYPMALLSGPT